MVAGFASTSTWDVAQRSHMEGNVNVDGTFACVVDAMHRTQSLNILQRTKGNRLDYMAELTELLQKGHHWLMHWSLKSSQAAPVSQLACASWA